MVMDQAAAAVVQQLVAALKPFQPRPSLMREPIAALLGPGSAVDVPAGSVTLASAQAAQAAVNAGDAALAAAQPTS